MRNIDRPLPGDPMGSRKSHGHSELSKKRSAYFESEFATTNRDPDPVRARVQNEAIVLAELRTNVIIKDEQSFLTDLSYHLSSRYHRPISSIVVSIKHSCCIMFGGTFEPAYTLTIHALPCLVQPTTNKRNAALIQHHIKDTLGVMPSRGYVHFVATPEDNVAVGGKTIAAEIEKSTTDDRTAETRKTTKSNRRIGVKSFGSFKSASTIDLARVPTPPPSTSDDATPIATIPEVPPTPPEDDQLGELVEQKPIKTAPRRRSLRFSLFSGKGAA